MARKKKYHGYEPAKILIEVGRIISSSLDMEEVSELVLTESIAALDADHAALFLIDSGNDRLMLSKAKGFSVDEMDNIKLLGAWEVVNEILLKSKRSIIVNDIRKSPIFRTRSLPFSDERLPIVSFLAVPLIKDKKLDDRQIIDLYVNHEKIIKKIS